MATRNAGKEAYMDQEVLNGNVSLYSGNDGDAFGQPVSSAFGPQKSQDQAQKVSVELVGQKTHLDLHRSNLRLDMYLFHQSSRL